MTNLNFEGAGDFSPENYGGRNFHFGIREHSMAAICNGMSLSGLRSYCATFFVFTDYLRPALRLSSIMHQDVIYIMTHDSIGLGEDGHAPAVSHLASCQIGRKCISAADANEVAEAYHALATARRHRCWSDTPGVAIQGFEDTPPVILIGTGSEVTFVWMPRNNLLLKALLLV